MAVFILEDELSLSTNLDKHLLFVRFIRGSCFMNLSPQAPTHFGKRAGNWGTGVGQVLMGRTGTGQAFDIR